MAVSYTPYAAWNSRISINFVVFAAYRWSVNMKSEDIDATNFEGGGFEEWVTFVGQAGVGLGLDGVGSAAPANRTVVGCDLSAEAFWDAANNPLSGAGVLKLLPGTQIANVVFYVNNSQVKSWLFPFVKVSTATVDAEVKGGVKFSFTGKSDGRFSVPQG